MTRLALLPLCLALSSCVPWTVRPLNEAAPQDSARKAPFEPHSFVDSIWAAKLLPALEASAKPLEALATLQPGASAAVKAEATVTALHLEGQLRTATLSSTPIGPALAILQLGPVVRGNPLRDATPVVTFSQFSNQLQFADAGNELNRRALAEALASIDPAKLRNARLRLLGAATRPPQGPPEIVPVRLELLPSRP